MLERVFSTYFFTLEVLQRRSKDVELEYDFPNVFQEIPGMHPCKVIEIKIDLVPSKTSVSKVAYQMAPKLLFKIKKQLTKLKDMG